MFQKEKNQLTWRLKGETGTNENRFDFYDIPYPTSWTHCAIVFQSGHAYLYIDGVSQGEADNYGTGYDHLIDDTNFKFIGVDTHYTGDWNGRLDEVRFYDAVLTQSEITQLAAGYDPELQSVSIQTDGDFGYGNNGSRLTNNFS